MGKEQVRVIDNSAAEDIYFDTSRLISLCYAGQHFAMDYRQGRLVTLGTCTGRHHGGAQPITDSIIDSLPANVQRHLGLVQVVPAQEIMVITTLNHLEICEAGTWLPLSLRMTREDFVHDGDFRIFEYKKFGRTHAAYIENDGGRGVKHELGVVDTPRYQRRLARCINEGVVGQNRYREEIIELKADLMRLRSGPMPARVASEIQSAEQMLATLIQRGRSSALKTEAAQASAADHVKRVRQLLALEDELGESIPRAVGTEAEEV